ncbi:hypothetical protein [Pseudomaricurvus sp. HS19]|uniref:hypothetical protein n=1 Tax=Pseudomaricurvus sp. HS19 TaxID=2692626 RepID=UPI00136FF922|nr:hypothetical protein [Pseudomaricurvus sp. HS19]MYM63837.1 hypothetical protein [Pseudomaricurvus sp. HS19]
MQRTFNYTGRRRIEQDEALFSFYGPEDFPSFNVEFRLKEKEFPDEAKIYVEAYYKETRQRYDFGTVGRISPPKDRALSEIDLSGSTLFRVLIVDESGSNGLLLASGHSFRGDQDPDDDQSRDSLLAVVKKPLGQVVWRVEFETGGMPELCLNNNIPNAIDKMKSDPYFQTLILPAALKQILMYFLWNDDEDSEASDKWLGFANYFGGTKPETKDPSEIMIWVDEIVSEFSKKFDLNDRLVAVIKEEE